MELTDRLEVVGALVGLGTMDEVLGAAAAAWAASVEYCLPLGSMVSTSDSVSSSGGGLSLASSSRS